MLEKKEQLAAPPLSPWGGGKKRKREPNPQGAKGMFKKSKRVAPPVQARGPPKS